MSPIRTFIQRPVFTSMLALAVIVFGITAFPRIGVDLIPEIDLPVVTVTTVLPGADPEAMEKNVSEPLEEALNTLPGLESIRSQNYESVSVVVLQFALDRPVDIAAQDVRDRVQANLRKLPAEIDGLPTVQKLDLQAQPILTLAATGPVPAQALTKLVEDSLKPALQRIDGVGSIDVYGGREREITVEVDPVRLRAFRLAATDVTQAIQLQSIDIPGGRTAEPGLERVVKLETEARSVEELRDLVVAPIPGAPVRLRDVANVIDGPAEARSTVLLNGRPAVGLQIRKQSGSNTVAVATRVKEALPELARLLPAGSQLQLVTDNSKMIRNAISSVQEDLLLGALLAAVVVLVFLRSWRSTIICAVSLPTSIVGTFAALHAFGFTFNMMTMLALTLSVGLLIDDAIVVIENIVRHVERGKTPMQAALEGTGEIALAVLAVTLSVVAVFLPVAFMQGITGRLFLQFGVTVVVAVAISYGVSMILVPMMAARVLKAHASSGQGRLAALAERPFLALERLYGSVLGWGLRHRALTMLGAVAILAGSVGLARYINATFIPNMDSSAFAVALEMPLGTRVEDTERQAEAIAAQVRALPGVRETLTVVGGGVDEAVHKARITVNLVPIAGRAYGQEQAVEWVREHVKPPPGALMAVENTSISNAGAGRAQAIQFNIRGDRWEDVLAASEKTMAFLRKDPSFVDVDSTYRSGKPMISVQLDRDRAATLGLPAALVGSTLRTFLGGTAFTTYREGGDRIDVKVRLPEAYRAQPEQLESLALRSPTGALVELRSVAKLVSADGPSQIDRQALKRQITVLADLKGLAMSAANARIAEFAKAEFPAAKIQTEFDGMGKEMGSAGAAFVIALLLGVILVYMILASQFESLLDPVTIMMSLPLSVIGALLALLAFNEYLSVFTMIGMIMLAGLVTKNGILLVDFTNQLRRAGRATREALLEAGPLRLRPILMTSVAMIAGMIPVAAARGDGAELRVGMALAIIGGLLTSTILTLVVVPVLYSLFDGLRGRFSRKGPGTHVEGHAAALKAVEPEPYMPLEEGELKKPVAEA